MDPVTRDDLMRFLDGELPPDEHQRVEQLLNESTELLREVALFRMMKKDLQGLHLAGAPPGWSVWDRLNRKLTRPVGWLFLIVGTIVWVAYGSYIYARSAVDPLEKLATAGIVIGIVLLLTSVIWERYREWLADPYKHIQQ